MSVYVLVEHDNKKLRPTTLNVLSAAKELANTAGAGEVVAVVLGKGCSSVAAETAKVAGVTKVLHADHASLEHPLPEAVAPALAKLAKGAGYVIAPATTFGKNVLPRVAALMDVAQISDVTKIVSADTFEHPIYAGNAIETVKTTDATKLLTIRTTAFDTAAKEGNAAVEEITIDVSQAGSKFVKQTEVKSERPELTAARVVVSGGRALQSSENFKLIEDLADRLEAAIGASRAAVDAGYVPNDYQVGQTGKVVAPDLYIAIGISGAIQHLAGMKDSKVIVAINKDEEAPIFQIADYGLVGDLFTIIPELNKLLDADQSQASA